jgi:hypothetical protein
MNSNMPAELLLKERRQLSLVSFVEVKVWRVAPPVRGSHHAFEYALAYVVEGVCVLRYDNEAGKGDHRHLGDVETAYPFTTAEQLLADFWKDVEDWRQP